VPHESSVRAHRSSITQTLAFDPRRAALHFRPPVLQRAERKSTTRRASFLAHGMIITGLAQRVVFRRERCGNGSGAYLHYVDPASDQGSRHDTHYSTLTWSWVDVSAGGHTRALLAPGQAVQRCHVRAIRRDSWDETGAVNGGVIARYVRTSTGGQRCTAGCLGSTTTTTTVTTRDG
jgi:hypothetical protein